MVEQVPLETSAVGVTLALAQGQWAVRPHEWSQFDGILPNQWRKYVAALCDEHQIPREFQIDAERELTVAINPSRPPTDKQLRDAIEKVLRLRSQARGRNPAG